MFDKVLRMERAGAGRPVMLAIAGDGAAGKTTLTKGLVGAPPTSCTCTDTCPVRRAG